MVENRYLLKIAGFPGSFESTAKRDASQDMMKQGPTASRSGLATSNTVSGGIQMKPKIFGNPMGLEKPKLIDKIAEMVYNKDEDLPYRRRVEVAIFKDDKVLLTKNKDKKTGDEWYGFPGGGTEGDKDEVAAEKECLEEVGVAVKDLRKTDVYTTTEGISAKDGRQERYRGSKTRFFTAEYSGENKKLLGSEGDAVKYVWKTKAEALPLLKANKVDPSARIRTIKDHWPE